MEHIDFNVTIPERQQQEVTETSDIKITTVSSPWLEIPLRKHSGMVWPEVGLSDPGYIWWFLGQNQGFSDPLVDQAKFVARRLSRIKTPFPVEYIFHESNGGLVGVKLLLAGSYKPQPGQTKCLRGLNLFQSHIRFHRNDAGSLLLMQACKSLYFGDSDYQLTSSDCKKFIENPKNFY